MILGGFWTLSPKALNGLELRDGMFQHITVMLPVMLPVFGKPFPVCCRSLASYVRIVLHKELR